jgi:hypothetical protein
MVLQLHNQTSESGKGRVGSSGGKGMSIYEAIGLAWVIFSSALATVATLYLAFVGLKVLLNRDAKDSEVPVEVKEMFKIAR